MNKPRVIKDFEKLEEGIQEQIKLNYPYGFEKFLITFKNATGQFVSALPFETEDRYYLVRMTKQEARDIVLDDDDYNEEGELKDIIRQEYEEKYESDSDDLDIEEQEDESYDDD